MAKKRLTRAQTQHELDLVLDDIRQCRSYADRVQAQVRGELGSTSIHPQQEGDRLENDERMNEYYKEMSEILEAKAAKEAEEGKALADDFKSAERAAFMMRDELELLKLKKTDPELDDRQRQMLWNIKVKLLEYPALLADVTGNETFMQAIKKSYESKLQDFETTLKGLIHDVFELPITCSNKVSTLLTGFAETTLKPAISIVKLQHEQLETELGEAEKRSEKLKKRIERMEAEAEDETTETLRLYQDHQAREASLMDEIAELKKKLEAEREVNKTQNEEHKCETTDLKARHEKARTTAAEEAKSLREEVSSYALAAQESNRAKKELEYTVKEWRERADSRRDEHNQLKASFRTKEGQLGDAQRQVDSLKKELQNEKDAAAVVNETAEQMSRLLQWHISTLDNISLGEFESEDVLREMSAIVDTMEQYAGSTTEMLSMPKLPGLTIVGRAAEFPEPNLAAARRLWITSRCGSLALDVAQAFFIQREISSAQFPLLPWIHASLNRAVLTMCEKSTLTPDLAISSVWILQGLVYTASVAREWSSVWNPKIEEILTQMTHWLGEHVSDEASLLMMIVSHVNVMVTTHEAPSSSMSPKDVSESRRIDSGNSDIPDGMAMVVDISGIFILFTADNAFIFGANEVKVLELNIAGSMVIKFDQAVTGLPATLMELQLLDLRSPVEGWNRHQALLKSVLTQARIEYTNPFKKQRLR